MKIEHLALNVEDPLAMKDWYRQHLGLVPVREMLVAPYTTFLADESGLITVEIYKNASAVVPLYTQMDPLILHLAFVSADPDADRQRLVTAGASFVNEVKTEDGSHLVMLRDPWGLAIQLCKRGQPILKA